MPAYINSVRSLLFAALVAVVWPSAYRAARRRSRDPDQTRRIVPAGYDRDPTSQLYGARATRAEHTRLSSEVHAGRACAPGTEGSLPGDRFPRSSVRDARVR
jgi:hypothetical protein